MKPPQKNSASDNISIWTLIVFFLSAAAMLVTHWPLLRLPYFWDEAGYYIPAARDLYLTAALIPHSTMSNAHPPLVMAYLDRKSTRLNSSHVSISYAVFCL